MSSRLAPSPLIASLLLHAAGLAGASVLVPSRPAPVPSELIAVELVSPPPAPMPPPKPLVVKPRPVAKLTPPKLVTVPDESLPAPAVAPPAEPDAPIPDPPLPVAVTSPALDAGQGNALAPPRAERPATTPVEGGGVRTEAFTRGDFELTAGSGAPGRSGRGFAPSGSGDEGTGATAARADGLTSFARPRGGYQTRPVYPETARRAGVEGITILKFEVQANGGVGAVMVERSAGHQDLDRAAIAAVRRWEFEPARRGRQPVAAWVTLPVRFELR